MFSWANGWRTHVYDEFENNVWQYWSTHTHPRTHAQSRKLAEAIGYYEADSCNANQSRNIFYEQYFVIFCVCVCVCLYRYMLHFKLRFLRSLYYFAYFSSGIMPNTKAPKTNTTSATCVHLEHCTLFLHKPHGSFRSFLAFKLQTINVILIVIVIVAAILRNAKFYLHSHFVFARYGHSATTILKTTTANWLHAVFHTTLVVFVAKRICVS